MLQSGGDHSKVSSSCQRSPTASVPTGCRTMPRQPPCVQ